MTSKKQHVLEILLAEQPVVSMQLEDLAEKSGGNLEATRAALIDLQDEELVFLRNGWYRPSAVALSRQGR